MSQPTATEILAAALALPREERVRLAGRLLGSLDDGDDLDATKAWVNELRDRAAQVRAGSVALEDWDDVAARLRGRWRTSR